MSLSLSKCLSLSPCVFLSLSVDVYFSECDLVLPFRKKKERTKGMLQRDGGWERGEGVIPIGTRSQAVYSCYRGVLKPPACFHVCSGLSAQLPPKIIKRKWGYYCTVVDSICDCQN